jgi:hypothetical protein
MIRIPRAAKRTALTLAATMVLLAQGAPARADLHQMIQTVAQTWKAAGAIVVVDDTRFLNEDQTIPVLLPDLPDGACTTVLLLGSRGLGFRVTHADLSEGASHERIPSEAGAVSIEQCGDTPPRRLLVTTDSGRGALELAVARSPRPLPPLHAILPERAESQLGPMPEPGPLPALAAPAKRAEIAESRAKRDGATIAKRSTLHAGTDGTGGGGELLEPGCHFLTLFAVDPRVRGPRRWKLDLDAELRDSSDDRLLARDRTDAPDAQLPLCVAEPTRVNIAFAGSPPGDPVLVSHSAWPLPNHLPDASIWGAEARARIAHLLLARHVVSLPDDPVALAQGGSGTTDVPLSVQPGACYLAVVALVQGGAHALGLRVRVGAHDFGDDRGIDEVGAPVAFCAGQRSSARATVEARGTPLLGWGLVVYRTQVGVWELP